MTELYVQLASNDISISVFQLKMTCDRSKFYLHNTARPPKYPPLFWWNPLWKSSLMQTVWPHFSRLSVGAINTPASLTTRLPTRCVLGLKHQSRWSVFRRFVVWNRLKGRNESGACWARSPLCTYLSISIHSRWERLDLPSRADVEFLIEFSRLCLLLFAPFLSRN